MEDEIDLRQYVRVLIHHWKLIVGLTVLVGVIAALISLVLPPVYEATALVSVAQPRYSLRLDGVTENSQVPFKAYPVLALSDEVLTETLGQVRPLLPDEAAALAAFRDQLSAQPASDPSLLRLTVRDGDPARAAEIANTWAQIFAAKAGQLYGQDVANLASYEQQLALAQDQLAEAEQALSDFQANNQVIILTAQLETKGEILRDYLSRSHALQVLITDAQDLRGRLSRLDPGAASGITDDVAVLMLSARAFGDEMTPLQLQLGSGQSVSGRTVAEQLALVDDLLAALQSRVDETRAQAAALEPEFLDLQSRLGAAQTEESGLIRERDLAEAQYKTLAVKIEEAGIASQESANLVQVASRATLPTMPASPNLLLNTIAGAAVGLLLSVAMVFLAAWWHSPAPGSELSRLEQAPGQRAVAAGEHPADGYRLEAPAPREAQR